VSHDLRIPLRAMDGYSHMLEEDYGDRLDSEGKRMLRAITEVRDQAVAADRRLLTLSRLASARPNLVDVDMNSLVDEVLAEVRLPRIRRSCTVEPLAPAKADRTLLRQVWSNLHYQCVQVQQRRAQPVIAISSKVDDRMRGVHGRDNGVGFNMKYYDKLFGVFQRLHGEREFPARAWTRDRAPRRIAPRRARLAESRPDEGRHFSFHIARGSGRMTDDEPVDILLVEDNETDAEMTIRALRRKNLAEQLAWVKDGAEALDFIFGAARYESRSNGSPRVVLLDLKMPKVDGIEVLRQIKTHDEPRRCRS
jgi:light-regulated signal transduction histidine kinase (bacteriophytochrome)